VVLAFPSGHATAAFSLARVASEYHPKYKWLWYGIAARIAWSRVKVNAHDWDDVIAGAALGCWIGDVETDRGGILFRRWEW
jgi:membrane-associated phospholipid phosphatase